MTYKEFLLENRGMMEHMLNVMYEDPKNELKIIKNIIEEEDDHFKGIRSKKQKEIAAKNFEDICDNLDKYYITYRIVESLYEEIKEVEVNNLRMNHSLFYLDSCSYCPTIFAFERILETLAEVADPRSIEEDVQYIHFILNELKEKNYIDFEEVQGHKEIYPDSKYNPLLFHTIKNPNYLLRKKQKKRLLNKPERTSPISISKKQDQIRDILYNNNIPFAQEVHAKINGNEHRFDFMVYNYKGDPYLIEYDGEQHYKAVEMWGGEEGLKERQKRDKEKNEWASANGITLIRIPYTLNDIKLIDLLEETSRYIVI